MSTDASAVSAASPPPPPSVVESPVITSRTPASEPATGRNERGQFTKGSSTDLIPNRPTKTLLSARQVFKLDTSVQDDVTAAIEKATKRVGIDRALQSVESRPAPSVEKPRRARTKPAAAPPPAPVETPAETAAKPAETAAKLAEPAEPTKSPKVTVGGREYTLEEVQAKLAEIERGAAEPPPPAAPEPTPEERTAAEQKWVEDLAAKAEVPLTEDEVDTLLTGGEDAVELWKSIRKRDTAYAAMLAQKNIAEGLNPVLQQLFSAVKPLMQHYESLQRYSVTQQFVSKHPDLKNHLDLATQVAETLMKRYPKEFSALPDEQKMDEVARQTASILDAQWKRFNPSGSWRDAAKAAVPAAAVPPPPSPRPLASNPPSAAPATPPGNWQSSVAKSLRR